MNQCNEQTTDNVQNVKQLKNSLPVADASLYEAKEKLLAMLSDAQQRMTQAVERLEDALLDEPFPDRPNRAQDWNRTSTFYL